MADNSSEIEPLIVVILGCTGTGKSKLSIEIGRQIGGEIISADSMQLYKGLDIITNKVTAEERAMIPHHLLDFVDANERFSVVEFKTIALDVISDILTRQKVPIIVGGTNYYIESLLWENLIDEANKNYSEEQEIGSKCRKVKNKEQDEDDFACEKVEYEKFEDEKEVGSSNSCGFEQAERNDKERARKTNTHHISLHEKLAKVDPAMAEKLHPNDTRKIARSLQVYEQSGISHSEHIAEQQSQAGSSEYSGPMRFKNVCVLWLQCEYEALDRRLDARVDQMIEQGLVKELVEFFTSWKSRSFDTKVQNNEGIFQSIGFKEFREFLILGNTKVEDDPELFKRCLESMKCATRRYARKQVRWVNNRFLGRPSTSSPDVYGLDATDLGNWESNVLEKATDIVKSFSTGKKVTYLPVERILSCTTAKHSNHTCTICNGRIIIGDQNWPAHLRSRSHRHCKKKQQRFEEKSG